MVKIDKLNPSALPSPLLTDDPPGVAVDGAAEQRHLHRHPGLQRSHRGGAHGERRCYSGF